MEHWNIVDLALRVKKSCDKYVEILKVNQHTFG